MTNLTWYMSGIVLHMLLDVMPRLGEELGLHAVLGIHDILVRIWITGSVALTNGSGFVSGSRYNSGSDSFTPFFSIQKKLFFSYFLL